ncbi:DUF3575 domain-containing protein [uncultured Alistipes sp.]|uniref:DUF3575 domain-containing protein n=1 Tax=uncultured Alistipes sp. TaxID=538949 RepID=UPI002615C2F5|nr:DUF3575 domain-containing protein [uncultured Alistipes sp.]
MGKRIFLFICLLGLTTTSLPASAQPKSDTTYLFRFVPGDDMFYVPWNGNDEELERLLDCVARYRDPILNGDIPVEVVGCSRSAADPSGDLAIAKIRANRVKTELILRGGLTEACFRTKNRTTGGNCVTVRIVIPAKPAAEPAPTPAPAPEPAAKPAEETSAAPAPQPAGTSGTEALAPVLEEPDDTPAAAAAGPRTTGLSVRTNLLRWVTLTPDLGIEYRIAERWSVQVNGSWTSLTWRDKERRYALWEVAPEARHYIGAQKRGYVGAMFKVGQFNYKLSDTGRQGNLVGGGVTGGYVLPLSKSVSLDFTVGLGCLHADYDKYVVIDGVRVRRGAATTNWWGPVNAGVSLV